jgi:hypothetical protein
VRGLRVRLLGPSPLGLSAHCGDAKHTCAQQEHHAGQ